MVHRHSLSRAVRAVVLLLCIASFRTQPSHAALEFVSDVQLPNCWASGVALTGDYLLTCGSEETKALWILNVADPSRPTVVSTWGPHYAYAQQVAVQGDYAYVCDGASLLVFDISAPTTPTMVARLWAKPAGWPEGRPSPWFKEVTPMGDTAYVATGAEGMAVLDISDPTNPTVVGRADVVGYTSRLSVSGSHAYLAARVGGLQIVDFSDPASPTRVAEYRLVAPPMTMYEYYEGSVVGVQTRGSTAFVLSYYDSFVDVGGRVLLTALDVTDPSQPQPIGQLFLEGTHGSGYYGNDICQVTDTHAFVVARDTLTIVDVTDPSAMSVVSVFSLPKERVTVHAEGVDGDWVPRTIEDPRPWLGNFRYDETREIGYLFCAYWGLWVLDMSDLSRPGIVGLMPTAGEATEVHVWGNRAYLTDYNGGLFVFDVTDPGDPQLLAQYWDGVSRSWLTFHGDGAGSVYVPRTCPDWPPAPDNLGHIGLFDVSTPGSVREVGQIVPPVYGAVEFYDGIGASVFWFDGLLYVTHRGELFVYDVSTPGRPLLGHVTVVPSLQDRRYECEATPLLVRQDGAQVLAYVASKPLGLSIVDVTEAAAPVVVGSVDTPAGAAQMIDVEGDYAYVAQLMDGIWVVDVSDPTAPAAIASFAGAGSPMGSDYAVCVDVEGTTAWVADYSYGVYEWDVSDPASATMVGGPYSHTSGNQFSIDISGDYLYRADVGALEVYHILP
jgi:hypothetical protein